ncbi:very-long-chain (3R)-3-hydroxyacyl-CoA dehydratase isoform X1 [Neodiprion fabricii]|uniref:very-long-chain (3R)-3-hydroxyacyl-CoA dehydratase isoform X1 n=1 Tax=Neodiprion fabricii TaxID=2872261 RepID=UPI001ED8D976|nr:very-long-chain (3R)-3-hydroxyacyl-CoA dehydratase isoform X1 [Neodiprion fabricii]XP_046428693.1 very-long-chain (3R)-3-hydroxyacyl-CoA dehydratase isoform X1 [Neodiprion fabricii]
MPEVPSPFVYWAQTESQVTLKVDLTDVKNPGVDLHEKKLKFVANGQGARGPDSYAFTLDFHSGIDPEESNFKVIDRQVDFILRKKSSGWWPRLTSQPQKPAWLKIDFDKWKSQDADGDEDEGTGIDGEGKRDITKDYPNMYDKLYKEECGYRQEDLKKVYLVFYNLCQFVGFAYILMIMAVRYSRDGPDSMPTTYESVGTAMKFVQLLQFLEVMHPLFGYTKGGFMTPLLQVGARAIILFCMIESEPRMQTKPVVFYLFVVWSSVEIVRYPYYLTQLFKTEFSFLTWLRYTIWMPLYPLGFLCEGIIILRNIPYFEETNRFTVAMPNEWNFAFHFPSAMRIYLLLLCLPGMYIMMSHMNRVRYQKLSKTNIKRKYN